MLCWRVCMLQISAIKKKLEDCAPESELALYEDLPGMWMRALPSYNTSTDGRSTSTPHSLKFDPRKLRPLDLSLCLLPQGSKRGLTKSTGLHLFASRHIISSAHRHAFIQHICPNSVYHKPVGYPIGLPHSYTRPSPCASSSSTGPHRYPPRFCSHGGLRWSSKSPV